MLHWCLNIISWCGLASKICSLWIRSLSALEIVDYLYAGINLDFFFLETRQKEVNTSKLGRHKAQGWRACFF